ncbi:hypothetical protein GAP32_487A [Cronobacter phage vB_CsaM_GAP32]|uniref:Uncharacterized protein n=1 Tax=Cronobacter phage vB_CsaM_GAP32 TaxID=1141136 RepID=K4F6P2_9CAUD|nr:hypothetical protein GAP32_487A [Cronobacter phage vB_CsaM_GAP32]AFC21946.1 hypothetical protein GAP32_487A [Cronobacter phage vB_CsaM_GAP32]
MENISGIIGVTDYGVDTTTRIYNTPPDRERGIAKSVVTLREVYAWSESHYGLSAN